VERVVLFVVVGAAAVLVAWWLQRRQRPDPPSQPAYSVPAQLDRADFARPDAPWLVAVFSSATCLTCKGTWEKAAALASDSVAVEEVEAGERRDLHERYGIDAVPAVVVADADGVVRASFLGEPSAADLWAALAGLRD
jgi:hypothetical protein